MSVKDYMTKEVISISPEESVAHAADLMRDKGLRRLPVIEKAASWSCDRGDYGRCKPVKGNQFIYL